jgi:hypothetical protein
VTSQGEQNVQKQKYQTSPMYVHLYVRFCGLTTIYHQLIDGQKKNKKNDG